MDETRIAAIIDFLQAAERLKDTLRSGFTGEGRPESVAEHSWRLCLLVTLMARELEGVDQLRLLRLCIIHDLGEAISGDIPAIHQSGAGDKAAAERADFVTLTAPLPEDLRAEMLALWDEYEAAESPEAQMAKGFDKIETMLQHVAGRNPADFDYGFNLDYGVSATGRHPLLRQIREQVDALTRGRMEGKGTGS